MLSRSCRCLLVLVFMLSCSVTFAQQKWPATLLWRISGNGLQKPSYLFGTMHLQDKRLFNFTDSLYQFLEKAEGFAIEINFRDYMDTIVQRSIQKKEEEFLSDADEEVEVDSKKLDKGADSLLKEFGITKNKLTRKQLKKIRDYRINKIVQEGEMPTIVDAYLYGIALRQGKWLGGIEDVHDQMDVFDELGKNLDVNEVFIPEDKLRFSMEQLINIYLQQDLQGIADYTYRADPGYKDKVIVQRNIKMARRMDSLSALRSMFFAVGAAHLPGDSGVISFLRNKGFTVDPVFSAVRIPAANYSSKLQDLNWIKVNDENKLYTVEMPGVPSDHNMFGELLKMKMFFDVTTMTFYMSGNTMANAKNEKELNEALQEIAQRTGGSSGRVLSKKTIQQNGVQGMEGLIQNKDGFYRLRLLQKENVLYILMAGASKKSNLTTGDADRFFASFRANAAIKKDWIKFELPEKGFSISLPGQPRRNKLFEQQAEGSNWNFLVYDHVDVGSGLYFIIQIRELRGGYYLDGDSSFLSQFKENLAGKLDIIYKDERTSFQGFPSLQYNGFSKQDNLAYKTFNVIRGNRIYTLMVAGTSKSDSTIADYFLHSLFLYPYGVSTWSKFISPEGGFSTWAPAPLEKISSSTDEKSTQEHFLSYDSTRVISYEIFREPLSAFYWVKDDSAFFEKRIKAYINFGDSVLLKRRTNNGSLAGIEALVKMTDNNNLKKVRLFLNGDTVYTLISFIPTFHINETGHQKFFDDFRVDREEVSTIYNNKAERLLTALRTTDSAAFEKASVVLPEVEFEKNDLPFLHRALLENYRDSGNNYGVHDRLRRIVEELENPATIDFIRDHYHELKGSKESLKYPLLQLLASFKTLDAYGLLKQLLLANLPESGTSRGLAYALWDSLKLTRTLYPEILRLSKDSSFRELLVMVTNAMIDSNLLDIKEVLPYKPIYMGQAVQALRSMSDSNAAWWQLTDIIYLTGRFNDPAANELLRKFLRVNYTGVKEAAVISLARNNQHIDPKEIEKLAGEKEERLGLYKALKVIRKEHLFPAKYSSQKSLAESELYLIASDESEIESMSFIGERVTDFMGKKQRFYLFRVSYSAEDASSAYLGIAGPYALHSKESFTEGSASDIYWEEEFDKTAIEKQFRAHLSKVAESLQNIP